MPHPSLDPLPADVTAVYGQTPSSVTFVTEVQNRVFRFRDRQGERILRLTPERHRESRYVAAEIDWVRHLAAHGVPVAAPVAAHDGSYWRRVEIDGEGYTVSAFTYAPGEIGSASWWTLDVFREWGQVTAQMHRVSRDYHPIGASRTQWNTQLPRFAPETHDEEVAQTQLDDLVRQLKPLPRSPNSFGLIHADLHFWNFSVKEGKLTVFDFDNSEYNHFVADIATAVFEAATCAHRKGPRAVFIRHFLDAFLDGYRRENDPDPWLEHLPAFIRLREISIFLILSRRWRGRKLGEFQQGIFSALREGVIGTRPFLET